MRNINLCFILTLLVFNGSAGTSECTDERYASAEDVENLMQFRIDVAKENNEDGFDESDDNSSKTLHVECEFLMVGSDGPHVSEASATTDSYTYGTCTTIGHETYYLLDNDSIEDIYDGAWVKLVIEPIPTPRDLMADFPTPWKQLYAVQDVFSVFQTSRDVTQVNPERQNVSLVDSDYESKPIDIMMLLCDFNDHKVSLSDALLKKYTYSNQSDWSDSTKPWIGSLSDMVDKSTYGRLKVNEPVVIRVAIDENWVGQACNIGSFISKCNAAAEKEGHDLTKATFKEYFIPQSPANGCWWCGMAVYGCGHPSMLPNPNGCWAIYRCHNVAMRGHELGHNFGLLHAGGGRDMYEYGDPETVMGNGYTFTGFIAAEKYQLGVLKSVAGEVIDWNLGMQNSMTISSISLPLNQVGANGVAVKVACPDCKPRTRGYTMPGGFLWVQFRGDELYSSFNLPASYQNQVYIHLARRHLNPRHGKGTELWAKLGAGESYKPENCPYVFYVCKIEGDLAEIAVAASLSVAESQCGTEFKPPPITTTTTTTEPSTTKGLASQSSTYWILTAARAIDGDVKTNTHTNTEKNPWWQLDFGSSKLVTKVTLLNVEGDCASRLFFHRPICRFEYRARHFWKKKHGAVIRVSDKPCNGDTCPGAICTTLRRMRPDHRYTIDCDSKVGRYVSIQLPGKTRVLNMREVWVETTNGL